MKSILIKATIITIGIGLIFAFFGMKKCPSTHIIGSKNVQLTDKHPVKHVNNRGDLLVKTSTGFVKVKETTGKHKVGIYLDSKLGYSYELIRLGDFSLSIGLTSLGSFATIGYSLNKYLELQVGTNGIVGVGGRVL